MGANRVGRGGRALLVALLAVAIAGITGGTAFADGPSADSGVSAQVVGGSPVRATEYPTLAAILVSERGVDARDRLLCSGTVVSPRWILTAGHCSIGSFFGEPLLVQVGSRDLGDPHAITVHVNRITVHKIWFKKGIGYDVSLFHVSPAVPTPPTRLAAATDRPLEADGRGATIVGWGLTKRLGIEEFPDFRAHPPRRARAVDVPIMGDGPCVDVYRDFQPGFVVPASDVCAGNEGHDACYGDSGGPLFATDPNGQSVEIGITSRGAGCATKLFPGVFTAVSRVHGWIHHWTTHPCPNRADLSGEPIVIGPGGPVPGLSVPLFVC